MRLDAFGDPPNSEITNEKAWTKKLLLSVPLHREEVIDEPLYILHGTKPYNEVHSVILCELGRKK